jgi:lipopolysaccharide/colanic/teichoic acid biosynthesis glycosyltransferase
MQDSRYWIVKRLIDLLLGSLLSAVAAPVVLLGAVSILLSDGRPAFLRVVRIGQGGCRFELLKLRTMVRGADQHPLGSITVGDDPRILRFGAFLRRHKFDEFPQLINVVLGDMSLVGPRPEVPEYVALYSEEERQILQYRPGITSPASIKFVNEADLLRTAHDPRKTYLEVILPEEIRIDLEYMRRATILSDLGVLLDTVSTVLRR